MSIPEIMTTVYLIIGILLGTYWLIYWQPDHRVGADLFTESFSLALLFFILELFWLPILAGAVIGATGEMIRKVRKND